MAEPEAPRIGIVLPHRETLSKARSGAIGLCMRDFTLHSRFRASTMIYGGTPCDYEDTPYRQLTGWRRWYRRDRTAYFGAVAEAAKAERLDLIEVQNRPGVLRFMRARVPGAAFALHLHNDPQEMEGSRTARERAALMEVADIVFCVSGWVRDRFVEGLAAGAERVHVVYNGMDIANLPPAGQPKEKTVFFAGRLVRDKGVLELIEACALALPQLGGWRLKVAGGDKMGIFSGKVPQVAGALSALGSRCERMGLLGHADIMREFARAEISVVPTVTEEPLGRTAQEAMACGSALIASGSGGMAEAIGEAGVIVRPVTPEALAAAIVALAKDPPRRRALQAAGAARMAALFDIRAKAAELDELRLGALRRVASARGNA